MDDLPKGVSTLWGCIWGCTVCPSKKSKCTAQNNLGTL